MIERLRNPIRSYAWGSHTDIGELLGAAVPTAEPQAELWMGAHPSAPSVLGDGTALDARIATDPDQTLGRRVRGEFGARLPFLFKVLAAEVPLSLQAHPNAEQARNGFAAEERSGRPRDAPERNYRDPFGKPELLCALAPTEALCGFREVATTAELLAELAAPRLLPWAHARSWQTPADALRELVTYLLTVPAAARAPLVTEVADACRAAPRDSRFAAEHAVVRRLAAAYPDDVGAVTAILLNHVLLEPGEAVYLPAGNLHTYLSGFGIEVMAGSDNVLRGGLTGKRIDVAELLRVLDFSDGPPPVVHPEQVGPQEWTWPTPSREFRLSRVDAAGDAAGDASGGAADAAGRAVRLRDTGGPEILLVVAGTITVRSGSADPVRLVRGESVFKPAADPALTLSGSGTVYRVTTAA